ncbi:MAG TPA: heat shock protein HspQ [Azospirillaceae bacterium]|nr:heat shock protein HspQ [Azospirillaceae bacterium]
MTRVAKFRLGDVVRHRLFPFRGVVFDVDPVFANTESWWQAIPEEIRPSKDQPFYHLLAIGTQGPYVAYVSEQNLVPDGENGPVAHPDVPKRFGTFKDGRYEPNTARAGLN